MSANITIKNALKKYGENIIIPDLSVSIRQGEFFTLLGPSGCGKTTLLRMIAGFNSIEGGNFYFGDKKINDMDPSKRNIGMVFQNYAIFPHLTVRDNVAFGLKNRKCSKEVIQKETEKFLNLMHINEYSDRMPDRLSGGQQQRVALARALVIKPDVLLMDEPLSNLDAKLRVEMRSAIKKIQNEVGITTVYVTHDQEEAMAISDRIAVMYQGKIQHIGTPRDIYQRPSNLFVATFIGRSNIICSKIYKENDKMYLDLFGYKIEMNNIQQQYQYDMNVKISIRPEEFMICKNQNEGIEATVMDSIFLGLNTHYLMKLNDDSEVEIIQESEIDSNIHKGDKVKLTIKNEKINIFTFDGEVNIISGVKNDLEADV